MCDGVAFESAGMVEVELLQRLACREPGCSDTPFPAVRLPSGDLALQTRRQVLLVGPAGVAGMISKTAS